MEESKGRGLLVVLFSLLRLRYSYTCEGRERKRYRNIP